MNGKMWLHPATQANVKTLQSRAVEFIGPTRVCSLVAMKVSADCGMWMRL